MTAQDRIQELLAFLYGEQGGRATWARLEPRLASFRARDSAPAFRGTSTGRLTERDAFLITYGDQFTEPGRPPLQTLREFLDAHLRYELNGVHILPCFPYSSDDGFSVIDYLEIDPDLGTWADVDALGQDYRLMLDAVINHISRHSAWFQGFQRGVAPFTDYFIVVEPAVDLSMVVRPRALPLLTPVETPDGVRHVWTTFSDDQIDLNYANPQVLLEIIDVLLHYVAHGAEIIRLDAIAYLWKEPGTPCIHLPQTHAVVKLWRAVLDAVAPGVILITETNVPHAENISYFGSPLSEAAGTDEAQMVYNFSLAPLTLHALQTGDASRLSAWAATLAPPAAGATFFNFIASHDGIGVRPAEGILSAAELQGLVERTLAHGGQVSYKANPDGSRSVYELNITLYDFLNDASKPLPAVDVPRFLASQAILLSLAGVPGIYVHSLFGSRNCHACFDATGRARSLNREKFRLDALMKSLNDPAGHRRAVFDGYRHLLRQRRLSAAFHPAGSQQVLDLHKAVFALARVAPSGDAAVVCLVNVSAKPVPVDLDPVGSGLPPASSWFDLIGGQAAAARDGALSLTLAPYQATWLIPQGL